MTDYISREVAVKIAEKYGLAEGYTLGHHSGIADCIALEISHVPAADVAPVRHGYWIYKRRRSGGFRIRTGMLKNGERVKVLIDEREDTMEPFCSVCGAHNDSTNDQNMRYCPHCWAKMDEEVNNSAL